MLSWRNQSGRPLSSTAWLEAHHRAKLPERTEFAKRIIAKSPRRIVDLGCGPGVWLELFSHYADSRCEFIGIDSDPTTIEEARERSRLWKRTAEFRCHDIEKTPQMIPSADIYLAFNIFPYIKTLSVVLEVIRQKLRPGGILVIRQYDGGLLRLGPMSPSDRFLIDSSLQNSVLNSEQFLHYDLDRVFNAIGESNFGSKEIEFDVFKRIAPYPESFMGYFTNTIDWTLNYISDEARSRLENWFRRHKESGFSEPSYFSEVDLVAWLS